MKIEEVIIDGFKSYATRTVISKWDGQFNAVTGLNGSGKSNILDAICFVLGITTISSLRASNLQDLIYKRGQAGVTKASVTIIFSNLNVSASPIGFEHLRSITVTRQVVLGGNSKYLINGHKTQQQNVLDFFQSVHLNVNNPNFLIMQGKITQVLSMNVTEVLSLIEEAAGTRTFEERKERARRTISRKDTKLSEIKTLLENVVEPKLEILKKEKRKFLEFQKMETELEKMTRISTVYGYIDLTEKFLRNVEIREKNEIDYNENKQKLSQIEIEQQNLHEQFEKIRACWAENTSDASDFKVLESEEVKLSDAISQLSAQNKILQENISDEKKKIQDLEEELDLLRKLVEKNTVTEFNLNLKSSTEKLSNLKQLFNEKEDFFSTLYTGVSSSGTLNNGYHLLHTKTSESLSDCKKDINTLILKRTHLEKEIKKNSLNLDSAKNEYDLLIQTKKDHIEEIKKKEEELFSNSTVDSNFIHSLEETEFQLNQKLSDLNMKTNKIKKETNIYDYSHLKYNSDVDENSIKGFVFELFSLSLLHQKMSLALQVCAGSKLFNIVVSSLNCATSLIMNKNLKRRVTFIPLDRIRSLIIDNKKVEHVKRLFPNKANLALHLIEFDKSLLNAMEYIFGLTFICDDSETAKEITFNENIRSRSITLEGDVYDPEGNVSGGLQTVDATLLKKLQNYKNMNIEKQKIELELSDVKKKLLNLKKNKHIADDLRLQIDLKKYELNLLVKKINNNLSFLTLKQNDENLNQISVYNNQIKEKEKDCVKIQIELKKIQNDMNEFKLDKNLKLESLKNEIILLKDQIDKLQDYTDIETEKLQQLQIENDQRKKQVFALQETLYQSNETLKQLILSKESIEKEISKLSDKLNENISILNIKKKNYISLDSKINKVKHQIKSNSEKLISYNLTNQKLSLDLERLNSIIKNLNIEIDEMLKKNEWLIDKKIVDSILEKSSDFIPTEINKSVQELKNKVELLKHKVNFNIMSTIENVLKKESLLKEMIKTINKDKNKIFNTINKLNGYKKQKLESTQKKVSNDFGKIFSDLLPGNYAELVPVDSKDITKGLEIKVKLGNTWKESLVELSGGQRSLIALALIMGILIFKPAPIYILDEIDAALDLSHTQNIGHLIKNRFKDSQFIIVSLKEGMFSNANRIFRTRFQNGTSVVSTIS